MTIPKCPKHNKDLNMIYPENLEVLADFDCECILLKDGSWISRQSNDSIREREEQ